MRTFLAFLRAEILLHRRSLRSRLVLTIYPLLTLAPVLLNPLQGDMVSGPATALSRLVLIQPLGALLLAFGLSSRAADRTSREELLPLLVGSGYGNGQLVFGRACVQSLFFLLYTAVPHLVLALSLLAQGLTPDFVALIDSWLFWAWPMTVAMGWTFLALAILGGSDLAAILLLVVGGLLLDLLRGQFSGFESSFGWPFLSGATTQIQNLIELAALDREEVRITLIATEGPFDLWIALQRRTTDLLPALGLGLLLLSVACTRLGRHRADLPARSFTWAPSLGRLRQHLQADVGLRWPKTLLATGLLAAAAGLWVPEQHVRAFFAWGQQRFTAETTTQAAQIGGTDEQLKLLGIRLRADLGDSANLPSGRLESDFEIRFEQRGPSENQHLAFRLNPGLEIEDLQVRASDQALPASSERLHDRLFLRLDRPLRPGEILTVSGRLRGQPASPWLKLRPFLATHSFGETWAQMVLDPKARTRVRLAAGEWRPAISRNQIRLDANDLFPVPRYTAFAGQASSTQATEESQAEADPTPPEFDLSQVPLELEITFPAGWELFTSCAQKSVREAGRSTLRGICTTRPVDFVVRGGFYEVLQRGPVTLATLPLHAKAALPLFESLEHIHAQSAKAWPGLPPLGELILIEKLPWLDVAWPRHQYLYSPPKIAAFGQLLEIDERRLIATSYLDPLEMVEPLVVGRLLQKRQLASRESWAIGAFLREVVSRRLGLRPEGALLGGPEWYRGGYSQGIHQYQYFESQQGRRRVAALVADLEGRVGSGAIQQGIQDFLDQEGGEPGSLDEVIAAIDARSEESLEKFRDELLGLGALPRLELRGLQMLPLEKGGFLVVGELKNKARGEVLCPIVVHTERGELSLKVRVGGENSTPFRIETPHKPVMVELDPQQTCLRFVTTGELALERVHL